MGDEGHRGQAGDRGQMERLVDALCERLAEVLPRKQFEVTVEHGHAVRIRGLGERNGDTVWLTPVAVWRSRLPVEERLRIFLEAASQRVQKFVSRRNSPWPTLTAKPRVSIGEDRILVWWGGASEADAVVALRPISRREIECDGFV
jgi:hypothetical protein